MELLCVLLQQYLQKPYTFTHQELRRTKKTDTYQVSGNFHVQRQISECLLCRQRSMCSGWAAVADEVAHSPAQRLAYISSLRLNTSLCSVWAQMEM